MTACISCNPNVPPLLPRLWWHSSQLCQIWICLHPSPPRRHLAFDSTAPKRPQQPAWQDWVPSDGSLPLPQRSTFRPQYQIQSLQMVFNRGYLWSSLWERFFRELRKVVRISRAPEPEPCSVTWYRSIFYRFNMRSGKWGGNLCCLINQAVKFHGQTTITPTMKKQLPNVFITSSFPGKRASVDVNMEFSKHDSRFLEPAQACCMV